MDKTFTKLTGRPPIGTVWVNMQLVLAFSKVGGYTKLILSDGNFGIEVKETPEQIVELMNAPSDTSAHEMD